MKKFLIKSTIFLIVILASIYFVFLQADGKSDPFYKRFTSSIQSSLILGTSKAAQGLRPSVLKEQLGRSDIYNFSFTVAHSPYGPAYLQSIQQKLNPDTKDGIFIITVDSWSISSDGIDPDDPQLFDEKNTFMNSNSFNSNPNIHYLLNYYNDNYIKLLMNFSNMDLHDDGWLEVSVNIDSTRVNNRIDQEEVDGFKKIRSFNFSETRLGYLQKTIELLKQHGKVYLVRLPVHPKIAQVEEKLLPEFNSIIENLSKKEAVPYFDMAPLNSRYSYTDGNHLYKDSATEVSLKLAQWIKETEKLH